MLNENEIKVLAGYLTEVMPIGANYNRERFNDMLVFLCRHLKIDRDKLLAYM